MQTYLFEATQNPPVNWGTFLVCRMDVEFTWPSRLPGNDCPIPLLRQRGWSPDHVGVLDLETGEGGCFRLGGNARADLDKHRIRVCPLFEPFLEWLYKQDPSRLGELPKVVGLDAPAALHGYRRPGPGP